MPRVVSVQDRATAGFWVQRQDRVRERVDAVSAPETPLEHATLQLLAGVLNDGWPCPRCRSRPSGKGRLSCKYCDCVRPLRPGMDVLMQEFMPAVWERWQ